MNESAIIQKLIQVGQMLERGELEYSGAEADTIYYLEQYAALCIAYVRSSILKQIRQAFADYRRAEGCSCCRDMDAHEEAEKRLVELLKPEPYEDGSGWYWSKYRTDH